MNDQPRARLTPERRRTIPPVIEQSVLSRSRRRCALCYHLNGDLAEKHGQIAHLDQRRGNAVEDNLAFLCLFHHSIYDSKTSQHKNYTLTEVKAARNSLYSAIQMGKHLAPNPAAAPARSERREVDRKTLKDVISKLQSLVVYLRSFSANGTSFPIDFIRPINDFVGAGREPEVEFVDADLEAARKALIDRLDRLYRLVATVARPVPGQVGWYRIPIEWLDEKPSYYTKMAGRFDAAARQICGLYDGLVREGRRRLEE